MKDFEEIRFPTDISYGIYGGPEFSTDIVTTSNGHEFRNINWQHPRSKFNFSVNNLSKEQIDYLQTFFRARKGKAIGFRFKDHLDFKTSKQLIAIADGTQKNFQLIKTYDQTIRLITKPVPGTVVIFINNKISNNLTIDYSNGIISFDHAPKKGEIIHADFEFDIPVRFDTDFFAGSIDGYNNYSLLNISIIEIKP